MSEVYMNGRRALSRKSTAVRGGHAARSAPTATTAATKDVARTASASAWRVVALSGARDHEHRRRLRLQRRGAPLGAREWWQPGAGAGADAGARELECSVAVAVAVAAALALALALRVGAREQWRRSPIGGVVAAHVDEAAVVRRRRRAVLVDGGVRRRREARRRRRRAKELVHAVAAAQAACDDVRAAGVRRAGGRLEREHHLRVTVGVRVKVGVRVRIRSLL